MRRMTMMGLFAVACALGATRSLPAQKPGAVRVGDRVLLRVDGDPQLSDTFEVGAGPAVLLPAIGPVSLTGVAPEGLTAYFTGVLGKYMRDPVVHAELLIRVGVVGEVAKAGLLLGPQRPAVLRPADARRRSHQGSQRAQDEARAGEGSPLGRGEGQRRRDGAADAGRARAAVLRGPGGGHRRWCGATPWPRFRSSAFWWPFPRRFTPQ